MVNTENRTRDALKAQALTQRIATLVAQYESQMADMRADATIQIESLKSELESIKSQLQEKDARIVELDERVPVDVETQEVPD